jgi:hypothetical protein
MSAPVSGTLGYVVTQASVVAGHATVTTPNSRYLSRDTRILADSSPARIVSTPVIPLIFAQSGASRRSEAFETHSVA